MTTPAVVSPSAERAAAALDTVGRDPGAALAAADSALEAAEAEHDPTTAATAHRAAGLALRELGDLTRAEARLRQGVRLADQHGCVQSGAEARMSLAFILLDRGRLRAALVEADRAAGQLTGLAAVRLTCQRALILQRTGRLDEALAGYAAALPALRRAGDMLWQARLHNNRGMLHTDRGALSAADADFDRAITLWRILGKDVHAAESECNRGRVAALSGDAPAALACYDRADLVPSLQHRPSQRLLERCQVLLSVGLFDDARHTAERAVSELRAAGHRLDLAEAQLALAAASAALGRARAAEQEARAARTAFTRQGRPGWAALARLVTVRAAELGQPDSHALVKSALACADQLAAEGWRIAELDAVLVAARVAVRRGDLATAERALARVAHNSVGGTLELRVGGWHAQALLRLARDNRLGALAALRAGLALIERRQAALGATDMRVHVSAFGTELAALGLGLALDNGDARDTLAWAERARARSMRLRPVVPPHDPDLAAALAELRRLTDEDNRTRLTGGAPVAGRRAAEDRVVRASRVVRSPLHRPGNAPPKPTELAKALGDAVLVEFVRRNDDLFAVTVRRGRCRVHRVGSAAAVASAVDTATGALRTLALAFGTPAGRSAVRAAAVAAGEELDCLLLGPVRHEVAGHPLVLVPTAGLHSVPWGLLPGLRSVAVSVAPSAATWLRAARTPANGSGRAIFAAGPALPAARAEVVAIAERTPRAHVLLADEASVPAVLMALDGAALAHIAAHGRLRVDNPLLSALELMDGPLTVYDLEQLNRAPTTVVLPACQSGVTSVRAGDEVMGLVSALLTLGSRTVIATVAAVSDEHTQPLMVALHDELRRGVPPVVAMAAARLAADPHDDGAVAAAASFVCFGA